jgi:hypothetical protein
MDDVGRKWEQQQRSNVNNKKMLSPSPISTLKQIEEKEDFTLISLSNQDFKTKMVKKKHGDSHRKMSTQLS